jgi:hypothetical protein
MCVDVAVTADLDPNRLFIDEIVDDRKIVRRQVPQDIDVWLEEPEVYAHRVVVANASQLSGSDDLRNMLNGAREKEGVIDHQRDAATGGERYQLLPLGYRSAHRLLDEHVLSGENCATCEVEMGRDRRGDRYGINILVEDLACGREKLPGWETLPDGVAAALTHVGDGGEAELRARRKITEEVGSPVSEPDETNPSQRSSCDRNN